MTIHHAMWCHGHNLAIENVGALKVDRMGNGLHLTSPGAFTTWVHFAIPTPVLINDVRLSVGTVILRFKTGAGAMVTAVHVYDGENRIANFDNLKLSGGHLMEKFPIKVNGAHPRINYGLGISVQVGFHPDVSSKTIHLISAGCDFV